MLNKKIKYTDVNIGDEIICIDNSGSEKLAIDKKYKVLDIEPQLNWITTTCEDGDKQQYSLSRFITIADKRVEKLKQLGI